MLQVLTEMQPNQTLPLPVVLCVSRGLWQRVGCRLAQLLLPQHVVEVLSAVQQGRSCEGEGVAGQRAGGGHRAAAAGYSTVCVGVRHSVSRHDMLTTRCNNVCSTSGVRSSALDTGSPSLTLVEGVVIGCNVSDSGPVVYTNAKISSTLS